jgi:hypothetical protein
LNGEQESGDFMAANLFLVCGIQLGMEVFFPCCLKGGMKKSQNAE